MNTNTIAAATATVVAAVATLEKAKVWRNKTEGTLRGARNGQGSFPRALEQANKAKAAHKAALAGLAKANLGLIEAEKAMAAKFGAAERQDEKQAKRAQKMAHNSWKRAQAG